MKTDLRLYVALGFVIGAIIILAAVVAAMAIRGA